MPGFAERIAAARPASRDAVRGRNWVYVPYDQLTAGAGPLANSDPAATGIVLVESAEKARRRPYHKKKLAFVLSNERHFALERAERGHAVLYLAGEPPIAAQLERAVERHGIARLTVMEPAERELRDELAAARLPLEVVPNATWLTTREEFDALFPSGPPFRMDRFYRAVRRRSGILMEKPAGTKPLGGRFSFDAENRKPWRGDPPAPPRFSVAPDDVTREVMERVERLFPSHFGTLDGFDLPASAADAERAWRHALRHAVPHFGPFEDAISVAEGDLFHTKASALLNVGRLLPRRVVADVERAHGEGRVPIASAEGFVRQVLGWREYVRHAHRALDPRANALGAARPLPPAYWGAPSGLACLDAVVRQVVREGYSHHITRLMVLANVANLVGVDPRALADWFWFAYVDAFDWVVEPNVLGMGTWADGGAITTKPYVAGPAYIRRQSDACRGCRFDPTGKDASRPCPLTQMYWDYLARHAARLAGVERLRVPLAAARRRGAPRREEDRLVTERVAAALAAGTEVPRAVASPFRPGT